MDGKILSCIRRARMTDEERAEYEKEINRLLSQHEEEVTLLIAEMDAWLAKRPAPLPVNGKLANDWFDDERARNWLPPRWTDWPEST